jgi:two-component sensor histidine kinase/CheY-like chemotaxis protein
MKILIIEDNIPDMELIREFLEDYRAHAYNVVHVERLSTAIPYLSGSGIDIILSDLGLPDSQGIETLRTLKQRAGDIPIVVLTGLDNEMLGIEALKDGAQDYLVKGQMSGPSLARSLRYAIERNAIENDRKKMEMQVAKSLKEKEMLLKEIHHRVKNNMQIVSALLLLESQSLKDEGARTLFKESQNRIRSIALVHEQLYQSNNLNEIEYGGYLKKMVTPLFESFNADSKRISISIDVENTMITIEKAVPCSLIVNELLSNSIKHAFPQGRRGEIRIGFMLDKATNTYVLDYRDDGIGLPGEWAPEKSGTLGMKLIYGLTQQLSGTLRLERGKGFHVIITFSAAESKGVAA